MSSMSFDVDQCPVAPSSSNVSTPAVNRFSTNLLLLSSTEAASLSIFFSNSGLIVTATVGLCLPGTAYSSSIWLFNIVLQCNAFCQIFSDSTAAPQPQAFSDLQAISTGTFIENKRFPLVKQSAKATSSFDQTARHSNVFSDNT